MRSRILAVFACALLVSLRATAQEPVRQPAAVVNGQAISWKEVESAILEKPALSRYLGEGRKSSIVMDEIINKALEATIFRTIVLQRAVADPSLDHERIRREARSLVETLRASPRFDESRAAEESPAEVEEKVYLDLLADALIAKLTSGVKIDEQEIRARYEEANARLRERGGYARASHIFLSSPGFQCSEVDRDAAERARAIYEKAIAPGADFMMLARQYSESNTARYGGYLGRLRKGSQPEEFDAVLFTMEVGSISEPVRTENGYNIIWLIDRKYPEPPSYESVREGLRRTIAAEKRESIMERSMSEALAQSQVEVYWPAWRR